MTQKQINYCLIVFTVVILVGLLVGALGAPAMTDGKVFFAYNCVNRTHEHPCQDGVDLSVNGSKLATSLNNLTPHHQELLVRMYVYNKKYNTTTKRTLMMRDDA